MNEIEIVDKYNKYIKEKGLSKIPVDTNLFEATIEFMNEMQSQIECSTEELSNRHEEVMKSKNILVSVYTNASGFLWNMMMVDSGTDLGWSEYNGDCEMSGTFTSYGKALKDALDLIDKCDLDSFKKANKSQFHWGNYATYLNKNHR